MMMKKMVLSLISLLFPSCCLYCKKKSSTLLCEECSFFIFLVDPEKYDSCLGKEEKGKILCDLAATFYPTPQAKSLFFSIKKKRKIAKTIAAFVFFQLSYLNWPPFDRIECEKGDHFDALSLVAKELFHFCKFSQNGDLWDREVKTLFLGERIFALAEKEGYRMALFG